MNILWEYVQQCETPYYLWSCGELLTVCWESKNKKTFNVTRQAFVLSLSNQLLWQLETVNMNMDWVSLFVPVESACDEEKPCSGFIRSQCFCSEIGLMCLTALKVKVISSTLTTVSSGWDWRKSLHRFKYQTIIFSKNPRETAAERDSQRSACSTAWKRTALIFIDILNELFPP